MLTLLSMPLFPYTSRALLPVAITVLLAACIDAFTRELISSQVISVSEFSVEELIYREDGFPDHRYERSYKASYDGVGVTLGSFTDESPTGIVNKPVIFQEQLVVFSSSYVFFWRPGEKPRQFYPFLADGWYEYSLKARLNAFYDYRSSAVSMGDNQVVLHYDCTYCEKGKPRELLFYSTDDGVTFDICLKPMLDNVGCAK